MSSHGLGTAPVTLTRAQAEALDQALTHAFDYVYGEWGGTTSETRAVGPIEAAHRRRSSAAAPRQDTLPVSAWKPHVTVVLREAGLLLERDL